jgi:hypothetical protein
MAAQAEPRRLGASLALVALFAASATLTTLALRRLLPGGGAAELVDAKLARFTERKDELTVVFLGSSRVHRGFVPQVFDARTAAAGVATRSFNLGAPGSRAFESRTCSRASSTARPRASTTCSSIPREWRSCATSATSSRDR